MAASGDTASNTINVDANDANQCFEWATKTFQIRQYADAQRLAARAVEPQPDWAAAHALLGVAILFGSEHKVSEIVKAERILLHARELDPNLADAHLGL